MQNRLAEKDYHFFKDQLYDFMYTEDQNEISAYESYAYEHRDDKRWPTPATKQATTLRNTEVFLKFFVLFITAALLVASPLIMPWLGLYVMPCIAGWAISFLYSIRLSLKNQDISITNTENQRAMWIQSPAFLVFPSLLKTTLITTAWLHDMVAAVPRLVRYYSRKGTKNATFEDSIKRGGAWGSLIGSLCTIGATVVVGALLFNPYSLLGVAGIAAAVGIFLLVAPRIVKGFEFLGRLAGIFYTKKQAEKELALQSITNKKHSKDSHPTCTVAFVNTLPSNDELTKMQERDEEIPHYYYHRDKEDTNMSWTCYSVDYLPSGKVEANLKPCYEVKTELTTELTTNCSPDTKKTLITENQKKERINKDFRETLKTSTDGIYAKYEKHTAKKTPKGKEKQTSIMVLNRAEADSLQLEPRAIDFTKKENFPAQMPKRKVFRSTSQICRLALQDCLKPRNYAGRQSAGSILFDPAYTSPERLAELNKKGAHLESSEGIDNIKQTFLPLYDCYALKFKENLAKRQPREGSNQTQDDISDDLRSLMVEYATPYAS